MSSQVGSSPRRRGPSQSLLSKGKLHDAIVQFTEALSFNPDYAEARKNLNAALAR